MPLTNSKFYPSDEIAVMIGFDGTESKDAFNWYNNFNDAFPCRTTFALNQYYPELKSGHYFNRNLLALIQTSIENLGLSVVIEENFNLNGIVPVEPIASLAYGDDYLLVNEGLQIFGRLKMWESLGGKSEFYHDKILIEVLTESGVSSNILSLLRGQCDLMNIKLTS